MTAIPADHRGAHHALIRRLLTDAVKEIRELESGFALRYPAEEYDAVTGFVSRERLCCPFLTFTLVVFPDRGPLWLTLTGEEGAREFIRAELHLPAAS
jgi:hypothetical protein